MTAHRQGVPDDVAEDRAGQRCPRAIGRLRNRSKTPVFDVLGTASEQVPGVEEDDREHEDAGQFELQVVVHVTRVAPPKMYVNSTRYMIGVRTRPGRSSGFVPQLDQAAPGERERVRQSR